MEHASLMYGTLLSQLAVGTFIAGYALTRGKEAENARLRPAILAALIAGALGVLVFFTHLGVPTHAYNAIRNLGSSWLSREALLYPAFMLLLVLCLLTRDGKVLRALTALCGLALVLTTAMIYTLPGVPAWNSAATPLSFLLAAFLMGIPLAALLTKQGGRTCAFVLGAAALLA
ncbi:MAG: dimethyl sulfoxide reductase anchor subunit, partial [Mailhella sp.]|nr:dimethyl sulfoxide reductase anchor subunit [Mailhella sp.]